MGNEIRVNPPSVQDYGRKAQELFGRIRIELEGLVNDAVALPYYGPNAENFKRECGQIAADFATALTNDLRSIADAIQTTTTNISNSLGGSPVSIEFNGGTVPIPSIPPGDGSLGVNSGALDEFKVTSDRRMNQISEVLSTNLTNLSATDWTGNAKEQAVSSVQSYTANAKAKVDETRTGLASAVSTQIEVANRADQQV